MDKNRCGYIHTYTHRYNITTEPLKKIIMSFAATWMDLEIIKLSEICQKKTNSI